MKHIIIEGVDKCGKTTLAKFLSERLKMPIKKFSAPMNGNPFDEYADFLLNEKVPHIIDRCYMSELAYGPVKRGSSYISQIKKQVLEEAIKGKAVGIWCWDDTEKIAARFDADGETFTRKSEISQLQGKFDSEIDKSALEWFMYRIGDSMERVEGWCMASK